MDAMHGSQDATTHAAGIKRKREREEQKKRKYEKAGRRGTFYLTVQKEQRKNTTGAVNE